MIGTAQDIYTYFTTGVYSKHLKDVMLELSTTHKKSDGIILKVRFKKAKYFKFAVFSRNVTSLRHVRWVFKIV